MGVFQQSMLYYETQARDKGLRFVLGLDEAGRGPLAGPVVAAAVCLQRFDFQCKIDDSKKMTHRQREKAFHEIVDKAYVGIGLVGEKTIDMVNILKASHMAMENSVLQLIRNMPIRLTAQKDFRRRIMLLVDGPVFTSTLDFKYQTLVKGESRSLSIACASIVAKVYRDRVLNAFDKVFPQYGFRDHKGYGTRRHLLAIKKYGPCPIHRRTFNGVVAAL